MGALWIEVLLHFSPLLSLFTSDTLARDFSHFLWFFSELLFWTACWVLYCCGFHEKTKNREVTNWITPCFYSALVNIQNLRHLVFKTRIKYLLILANSFPSLFIDSPVSISPPPPHMDYSSRIGSNFKQWNLRVMWMLVGSSQRSIECTTMFTCFLLLFQHHVQTGSLLSPALSETPLAGWM